MTRNTDPRRAFVYTRISLDRKGEGLGVARQLKACREKAAALGWDVVEVFEENDTSASKGHRPRYTEMMARLARGEASGLIAWSLDRLTRRPREIEDVLDLAAERDVALATVSGDIDLGSSHGRAMARVVAAFARQEIEVKSERQRAANLQRAESGKAHAGRRTFGYDAKGSSVLKREAREIRAAVQSILQGGTLRAIVRDFERRGVRTTAGGPWRPTELRRMLSNPRYAGVLVRNGEVMGPGVWPAILDVDTHRAVVAILSDPARRRPGAPRRYLLSGVATCGVCGRRCYGATEKRGPLYLCQTRAHVVRRAEQIEELVEETVIARLSRPDAAELFARPDTSDRAAALAQSVQQTRARLDGLAEAFASGSIDAVQLGAGSKRLRPVLARDTAELAALAQAPILAPLVGVADVRARWSALSVEDRREVIAQLMSITIDPAGRGARTFDPQSVRIAWRTL